MRIAGLEAAQCRGLLAAVFLGLWEVFVLGPLAHAADLDISAYRGKVVYLDFWASWRGPARSRSLSTLTPITTKFCDAYSRTRRSNQGKDCLQGPHHEAQKSRYTTLPRYALKSRSAAYTMGPRSNAPHEPMTAQTRGTRL